MVGRSGYWRHPMVETLGAGWVRFIFEYAVESPVFLVGDFNGWDESVEPLQHKENGTHVALIRLEAGEYEYKYKSGCLWFNDSCAHKYVPNCWGSENSVVVVPPYDPQRDELRPAQEGQVDRSLLEERHSATQPSV
jgi:1,4-alpha-glucan branching enzyme